MDRVVLGAAKRSEHSPALSGESQIHRNSAAAMGKVQSIRQARVPLVLYK